MGKVHIKECDPILHEYYITKSAEFRLQDMNITKDVHELQKGILVS